MPRTTITISVDVTVSGSVSRGRRGTYWDPPEPPVAEIDSVTVGGIDITRALDAQTLDECRDALMEAAEAEEEVARERADELAAEMRREARSGDER